MKATEAAAKLAQLRAQLPDVQVGLPKAGETLAGWQDTLSSVLSNVPSGALPALLGAFRRGRNASPPAAGWQKRLAGLGRLTGLTRARRVVSATPNAVQGALSDIVAKLSALEAGLPASTSRAAALGLPPSPPAERPATVRAARRLNRAAGTIATSVLLDSAVEHYRGSFENPAMYTPIAVSALTLAASGHGLMDRLPRAHLARSAIYAGAALTGVVGTGFHFYNVTKRPGRLVWQNLFYGAPLGAPAAISLAGLLGSAAERVRNNPAGAVPRILGLPAGRTVAAVTGAGLLGSTAEAALLHFRGAFQNPFMFVPVTVPPVAAALMGETALGPSGRNRHFTRWWLRLTAFVGVAGVGLHLYGVQRQMGGWHNWRQNLLNGPPVPAPPAFTGLALAGLAALGLLEDHPDA